MRFDFDFRYVIVTTKPDMRIAIMVTNALGNKSREVGENDRSDIFLRNEEEEEAYYI